MVLKHASEKFRRAYELPLDSYELFGAFDKFLNVTVTPLDENSYRSDFLAKYDLWRKTPNSPELLDYRDFDQSFYDSDRDDQGVPDYDDQSQSALLYQWHRDRHFDTKNVITKYVDDTRWACRTVSLFHQWSMFICRINITVIDFVRDLPQFDRDHYQSARLPFDLFRPYAYLLEEKYRGRAGNSASPLFLSPLKNVLHWIFIRLKSSDRFRTWWDDRILPWTYATDRWSAFADTSAIHLWMGEEIQTSSLTRPCSKSFLGYIRRSLCFEERLPSDHRRRHRAFPSNTSDMCAVLYQRIHGYSIQWRISQSCHRGTPVRGGYLSRTDEGRLHSTASYLFLQESHAFRLRSFCRQTVSRGFIPEEQPIEGRCLHDLHL